VQSFTRFMCDLGIYAAQVVRSHYHRLIVKELSHPE